jgi:hypothetical protein
VWLAIAIVIAGLWVASWVSVLAAGRTSLGVDLSLYREATERWLAGGPFYQPYQLAGSYRVAYGAILYPPPIVLLIAPFIVLPAPLFWLVPAALIGLAIRRYRPTPWAWAAMALCLLWPPANQKLLAGNPLMWVMAAIAWAPLTGWPGPLAALKFSLGPFALLGIWRRAWWIGAAAALGVSLLFGSMWLDYLRAITHIAGPFPWAYSLNELPLAMLPVIAWLGRTRSSAETTTTRFRLFQRKPTSRPSSAP